MSFSEWLRIVPQLVSGVMGLFTCALLWAAEPPRIPQTADEARAFLSARPQMELDMEAALKVKAQACYQKTLVSGCLREVDQERARLRRDLRAAEVAANERLRIEKLSAKERDRLQPENDPPALGSPADLSVPASPADPTTPPPAPVSDQSTLAPPVATPGKAKPLRSAKPDIPTISPQEQADNRAEYDAKQRAAQARLARQQERLEATQAKRARYREQQAAQQRQLQERAEQAKRNSAETMTPAAPKQDAVR